MTNEFSPLDIQFIRSSLSTRTDEEIAEVLGVAVETVHSEINDITGGAAADRVIGILQLRACQQEEKLEKEKQRRIKVNRRDYEMESERKKKERETTRISQANQEAVRRSQRDRQSQYKKFKTRHVDLNKLISVRIDDKTHVFVEPGTDIEEVKKRYAKKPIEPMKKQERKTNFI